MNRPVTNEDMLRAILEIGGGLYREFDELKRALTQNGSEADAIKLEEIKLLTRELEELSRHIVNTKREISMIRGEGADTRMDRISSANFELDAIVKHTEDATDKIMTATEEIDAISSKIRSDITDEIQIKRLDEINSQVISIYEHCNFQDITGQRISKVIKTLNYIEMRIENMLHIWGGPLETSLGEASDFTNSDEAALLNGPQLPSSAVSQGEIDNLFGSSPPPAG